MKDRITLVDKLLVGNILLSFATTVLHGSIPMAVCTGVHILMTVVVSVVHIVQMKSPKVAAPAE